MKISRIGLITHMRVGGDLASKIADKLSKKGVSVFFDPIAAEKIGREKTEVRDMHVDVAVIAGGDGTILWAVRELPNNPLILGVNVGGVGYLAELKPEDVMDKMGLLFKGRFYVDHRLKLGVDNEFKVLNEALVLSKQPASLLGFKIKLDNIKIAEFRADGVMVSTPTGSTGYSMSSGGSILHPEADVYIITPINPFLREQFPLVVPADSETEIEPTREDRAAQLILDGQPVKEIKPHQRIHVRKSENYVRFVRFSRGFSYDYINIRRRE
jgi:NAD+ kinase